MSLTSRLSALVLGCGLMFCSISESVAQQQVLTPRQISFQGVISEGDKVPADGAQLMTFSLYPSQFSTQALWTEEQRVTIRGGLFNVYLGEKNPLPENFSREYWVGISIKGGAEFSRVKMTSVPYAFQAEKAQKADELSGGLVTRVNGMQGDIELRGGDGLEVRTSEAGGLVVGLSEEAKNEGLLNQGTEWLLAGNPNATAASWLGTANNNPLVMRTNNTERMRILSTGNIGIGETNPAVRLTVARQMMITNTGGTPELRIAASSGANYTAFRTTNQSATITYTLPAAGGAAGSALVTDANNNLSWTDLREWKTIGNSNLTSTSFIGSTNSQPFIIKTNNTERLRITPTGALGINEDTPVEKLEVAGNLVVKPTSSTTGELRIVEEFGGSGGNYTALRARSQSNNITWKLPQTQGAAGQVLTNNGTGELYWAPAGLSALSGWSLDGNAAAGGDFLGTTNTSPLDVRVNNTTRLYLLASGSLQRSSAGNLRGTEAIDLQTSRSAPGQVASGNYSIISGGRFNQASGLSSVVSGGESNLASGTGSVVSGGTSNVASNTGATIGGGNQNTASGIRSVVSGGNSNTASGQTSLVVGGSSNVANNTGAVVTGGDNNTASGSQSFVGSGSNNTASGTRALVVGGNTNTASGQTSVVVGGLNNLASGVSSAIVGGENNVASLNRAFIGTGTSNTASGVNSAVVAGNGNSASGQNALVGTGASNQAMGENSMIGSGRENQINNAGLNSGIISGFSNLITSNHVIIGGGFDNTAGAEKSFIGGGQFNVVDQGGTGGRVSFIGGGHRNQMFGDTSFIGGGSRNVVNLTSLYGFIGGGMLNSILTNDSSTIGGGASNTISVESDGSFIGGGINNTITDNSRIGTITGGRANTITTTSIYGFIGAGHLNTQNDVDSSVIGGGASNLINDNSDASIIGGGMNNTIQTTSLVGVIGGGRGNTITNADSATIGGGAMNLITTDADASTIGGGNNNTINSNSISSTIGGGHTNTIGNASFSVTIGGGNSNDIGNTANYTTIGGGNNNNIGSFSNGATISGGITNNISTTALNSTISGGINNNIGTTTDATIGGGNDNNIADAGNYATISGGRSNDIGTATDAIIGGGNDNNIANGGTNSAILGGTLNDIGTTTNAVIGGGSDNNIATGANFGAILGGVTNNINGGTHNLIGGGLSNTITTGNYNAILGGQNNLVVSGNHSAVLGGINNSVTGDLAFALGTGNTAANNGFALGNGSTADANEYYAKYSAGFVMEGAGTANQNFTATFINPTDGNGIAIQLGNATPGVTNHFVEFRNSGGTVVGRIEGQQTNDIDQLNDGAPNGDSENINTLALHDFIIQGAEGDRDDAIIGLTQAITGAVVLGLDIAQTVVEAAGEASCAAGTLGLCSGSAAASALTVVVKVGEAVLAIADIVISAVQLANAIQGVEDAKTLKCDYITYMKANVGVSYESGAADYAEWLPKLNPAEKFVPTDIVALKAGKITKNTADADQFMVISSKPIVLGNTPAPGENKKDFEKVAFMGQVPVRVLGKVNQGDYILPSGGNNGFGIAVSPNNMKTEDFKKIVGVAWSASKENQNINIINVAVGLNTNSLAAVIEKQAKQILQLQQAVSYTQDHIKKTNDQMSAISSALSQMLPGFDAALKSKGVDLKNPIPDLKLDIPAIDLPKNVTSPVINSQSMTNIPQSPSASAQSILNASVAEKEAFVRATVAKFTEAKSVNITEYEVPKTFFDDDAIKNGFLMAEQKLKDRGIDLKSNPIFAKMFNDPAYKNTVMKNVQDELNKAAIDMKMKEYAEQKQ
jgi:hypothetical protein